MTSLLNRMNCIGVVDSEFRIKEFLCLGNRQMQVIDAMYFDLQVRCSQAQHMATEFVVVADEVKVISSDADGTRERRAPESDQSSANAFTDEFRLMRSRIDQRDTRFALTGGTQLKSIEGSSDTDTQEAVVRLPVSIQLLSEVAPTVDSGQVIGFVRSELRDDRKGSQLVTVGEHDRSIATCLEALSIEHDHLAIE